MGGAGRSVGGENFEAEKGGRKIPGQGKRMCFWFIPKKA